MKNRKLGLCGRDKKYLNLLRVTRVVLTEIRIRLSQNQARAERLNRRLAFAHQANPVICYLCC